MCRLGPFDLSQLLARDRDPQHLGKGRDDPILKRKDVAHRPVDLVNSDGLL